MQQVLTGFTFLETLTDIELFNLCRTSKTFREQCAEYLPGRALKRYKVTLDPEFVFEQFSILSEREYGNKCESVTIQVQMIGAIFTDDLELLEQLLLACRMQNERLPERIPIPKHGQNWDENSP